MEKMGNMKIPSQENSEGKMLLHSSFRAAGAFLLATALLCCDRVVSLSCLFCCGFGDEPLANHFHLLCREDLGCRREVHHCWPDWFGGEKRTLHLSSVLLAIA